MHLGCVFGAEIERIVATVEAERIEKCILPSARRRGFALSLLSTIATSVTD
jgi:hypothetical protein